MMYHRLFFALCLMATQPWCYCGAQGAPRPRVAPELARPILPSADEVGVTPDTDVDPDGEGGPSR